VAEVVLALDLPDATESLRLLDRIPQVTWVKVGSILMTREGGSLLRELVGRGHRVFLDLKWHDIPNTVAGAVTAAREHGVAMATVHALGGRGMMEAAAAAAGDDLTLVGVTVLTSHDRASYGAATGRPEVDLAAEAVRQATEAAASGLAGVVCSSREVAAVRGVLPPDAVVVVPGIRRTTDPSGDQTRVATPQEAVRAGATHLVVGRPVLGAPDPGAVMRELIEEARCVRS
jgi:orotidine-5'-phosphate decarboxylase